jgi:hypothetical protein
MSLSLKEGAPYMKTYQIAGILILISYRYQSYFLDNIEKYEIQTDIVPKYKISSYKTNEIKAPYEKSLKQKNPYIVHGENESYFYIKNKNHQIKAMFIHDSNFYDTRILLNEDLLEDCEEIEYVFMSMIFMEIASRQRFISLHASAISYQNEGILISAPSQTGKSTHASYWLKAFKDATMINDDKPLIRLENEQLFVYGTPFSGKGKRNENMKVQLKTIIFISQGLDNKITIPNKDDIIFSLLKNMHRPMEDDIWNDSIAILDEIILRIPIYTLSATHSIDSAITLKEYLYQEKNS